MADQAIPILYSAEAIKAKVRDMATAIRGSLGEEFIVVSLLKGAFMFTADLMRELHAEGCRPRVDFMTLSSYGNGMESTGLVEIHRDIDEDVAGKKVLIVDDILETGRTLFFARKILQERGAASVHIAVLLEKPGKRYAEVHADFTGFTIPDRFVVGYGLDHAGHYRELPFIGYVEEEPS